MIYVPEFVALYEIIPYIEYLSLNNESIRVAVTDYVEGGETRDSIINKYGKIEDWNTSVVSFSTLFISFLTYFFIFPHVFLALLLNLEFNSTSKNLKV